MAGSGFSGASLSLSGTSSDLSWARSGLLGAGLGLPGSSSGLSGTGSCLSGAGPNLYGAGSGLPAAVSGLLVHTYRFPLCSTGLHPLRGRSPKRVSSSNETVNFYVFPVMFFLFCFSTVIE